MRPCPYELPDFLEPLLRASDRVGPCYLSTTTARSGSKLPIRRADGPRCQVDRLLVCTFLQLNDGDRFAGLYLAAFAHSCYRLSGTNPVDRQRSTRMQISICAASKIIQSLISKVPLFRTATPDMHPAHLHTLQNHADACQRFRK